MRMFIACLLALLGAVGPVRGAPLRAERLGYPASRIERPMTLPPTLVEASVDTLVDHFEPVPASSSGGANVSLRAAVDVGLTRRLQAGLALTVPVYPLTGLDLLASAQVNLVPQVLNVRLDAAVTYVPLRLVSSSGRADFTAGVGLPLRLRLQRCLALTSGSAATRGLGSLFAAPYLLSSDLVTLSYRGATPADSGVLILSLHLPVALLVQPHPFVSFSIGAGYRFQYVRSVPNGGAVTLIEHYVPLRLDLVVSPKGLLDIGVAVLIPGQVSSRSYVSEVTGRMSYQHIQQYQLWLALRL